MFYVMLAEVIMATLYLIIYLMVDRVITKKRLRENQLAWNEYSKNMTFDEKIDCYIDWCKQRKLEKGWRFYYFPRQ